MGPDVMDKQGGSSSEEEEGISEDEDRLEERRRRFCMERRQELAAPSDSDSAPKPIRSIKSLRPGPRNVRDMKRPRNDNYNHMAVNKRRRVAGGGGGGYNPYPQSHHHHQHQHHTHHQHHPHHQHHHQHHLQPPSNQPNAHQQRASNLTVVKVSKELPPPGPVIFINPSFVKRFLEKYIKLASNTANPAAAAAATNSSLRHSAPEAGANHLPDLARTEASSSAGTHESRRPADSTIERCPIGSLQAACTMAIIRLVTECIEDDNKRDEKLNKRLVAQLLEKLRPVH